MKYDIVINIKYFIRRGKGVEGKVGVVLLL